MRNFYTIILITLKYLFNEQEVYYANKSFIWSI